MKKRNNSRDYSGLDCDNQLVKAYVVQNIAIGEIKSWIPNLVSLTAKYLPEALFLCSRSTVVFNHL